MMLFVRVMIIIVNVISTVFTVLFSIFGIYDEILGSASAENLLKTLHIPLNHNQMLIFGVVCAALMLVTHIILRTKLSR